MGKEPAANGRHRGLEQLIIIIIIIIIQKTQLQTTIPHRQVLQILYRKVYNLRLAEICGLFYVYTKNELTKIINR
jgi:hypothetical protein